MGACGIMISARGGRARWRPSHTRTTPRADRVDQPSRDAARAWMNTSCPGLSAFDTARLPYLWLPGLPIRRLPAAAYVGNSRIEVMHRQDANTASRRFEWLYGAPGSGVWWDGGRKAVASNFFEAVAMWNSYDVIGKHLDGIEASTRNGGFRQQLWLVQRKQQQCGDCPSWYRLLRGRCSGCDPRQWKGRLARTGEWLEALLPDRPPGGIESLVLVNQTQTWLNNDFVGIPEIIDFRFRRVDAGAQARRHGDPHGVYAHFAADKAGTQPCAPGPMADRCYSCSRLAHILCACAMALEPEPRWWHRGGRHRAEDNGQTVQLKHCCEAHSTSRAFRPVVGTRPTGRFKIAGR